jgi:hypothetical protein
LLGKIAALVPSISRPSRRTPRSSDSDFFSY